LGGGRGGRDYRKGKPGCHTRETVARRIQKVVGNLNGEKARFEKIGTAANFKVKNEGKFPGISANCRWDRVLDGQKTVKKKKRRRGRGLVHKRVANKKRSAERGTQNSRFQWESAAREPFLLIWSTQSDKGAQLGERGGAEKEVGKKRKKMPDSNCLSGN